MSIKKSQQIVYNINRAKHKNQLKYIRSSIDNSLPIQFQSCPKHHQNIPYMKKYQIKLDNQLMVNRILSIAKSQHSQLEKQGYTKYNDSIKLFRNNSLLKNKLISRQNIDLKARIKQVKSSIGLLKQLSRKYSERINFFHNRYVSQSQSKNKSQIKNQHGQYSQFGTRSRLKINQLQQKDIKNSFDHVQAKLTKKVSQSIKINK